MVAPWLFPPPLLRAFRVQPLYCHGGQQKGKPRWICKQRRAPERSLRMRHGIDLDSADYAGRKSSRQAVYGDDAPPDDISGPESADGTGSDSMSDAADDGGGGSDASGSSEDAADAEDAADGSAEGEGAEDDDLDAAQLPGRQQAEDDGVNGAKACAMVETSLIGTSLYIRTRRQRRRMT